MGRARDPNSNAELDGSIEFPVFKRLIAELGAEKELPAHGSQLLDQWKVFP
jgi:hypothetical protein